MSRRSGAPTDAEPAADVTGLRVETPRGDPILEDVTLELRRGEVLGLVGESGSGKTTTGLALLGYTQGGARITSGEVRLSGESIPAMDERAMRRRRGGDITYVPQNPGRALNPALRIGDAIAEMLRAHGETGAAAGAVGKALASVGLPATEEFQRRYPHQLSGGQQQRVCIAVAVVCEPPIVVLDEPTTGLDVVTQARIIDELIRLRGEQQISMVYIAHDLAVVAQVADRIAVMYAGRVIEEGPARTILRTPRHPYTSGLLASVPDHLRPRVLQPMAGVSVAVGERPDGCAFASRCPLCVEECTQAVPELAPIGDDHFSRCRRAHIVTAPKLAPLALEHRLNTASEPVLTVSHLRAEHRGRGQSVVAARDISFTVARGECVGLVGESGSGKTTIARAVAGLHPPTSGEIHLHDKPLAPSARSRTREERRSVQMIFQNPGDALNPRHMVRDAIARPARLLRGLGGAAADAEVQRLLELVRLSQRVAERYPTELSGGERQRIGIARALASEPELIICDEVTSALDVSVQAAVLKLLGDLKQELGLSLLFITHDLGVVATIADSLLVLDHGDVCEQGSVQSVFDAAQHPYTRGLMAAAPSITAVLEDSEQAHSGPGATSPGPIAHREGEDEHGHDRND